MADTNTSIYEYERILLGRQSKFWVAFKGDIGGRANQKEFGAVWRYAIETILKWRPEDAVKYLNSDTVKQMKLDTTLYAIDYDNQKHFIGDYKRAIQLAFPEEKIYDFYTETLDEYKKTAKEGEWRNDTVPYRYHKKFFSDAEGFDRAKIIMNWLLQSYYSDEDAETLYRHFYNPDWARKFISKHRLELPTRLLYSKNAYEYFHDSYRFRNQYLYNKIKLEAAINENVKKIKAEQKAELRRRKQEESEKADA